MNRLSLALVLLALAASVGVAVFHKESLRHLILDELVRREKP